jgi:microsomal dipeptidase-like Zn-dependent dipeptidase
MSDRGIRETLAVLDRVDPQRKTPVMATHSACRFDDTEYNISRPTVEAIAARDGVIGLIVCKHWMSVGLPKPNNFDDSMRLIKKHADTIFEWTNGTHRHTAIGSDMDGFIKPPLPGIEKPLDLNAVRHNLADLYDSKDIAKMICSQNALRMLEYWGKKP